MEAEPLEPEVRVAEEMVTTEQLLQLLELQIEAAAAAGQTILHQHLDLLAAQVVLALLLSNCPETKLEHSRAV
jgi:hypothetical protein